MNQSHKFEDNEQVRIKGTEEVVTVDHWWFGNLGSTRFIAQYNIKQKPGTWYSEDELEKVKISK